MGKIFVRAALATFAFAFIAAAAWAALPAGPAWAITNCDTATAGLDGEEQQMLQLINAARVTEGLPALAVSPSLSRAAAWYSEDTQDGQVAAPHEDSLGRFPSERAQDCGYPGSAGENWAWGFGGASSTFDAWMGSSGHRANILNSFYKVVGIGRYGSAWTLNFGAIDDSNSPPPQPTPTPTTHSPAPTNTPAATNTPASTQAPSTQTPTPEPTQASPARLEPSGARTVPTTTTTVRNAPRADESRALEMSQGLNLVTYSGKSRPIADALGALGPNVRWVYTWDGEQWLRYFPGSPAYVNSLTSLEQGQAYFIALRAPALWSY